MEQSIQTKNSPYSVMDYNNLLMNLIHSIYFNMGLGDTGIEQAQNLRATLKPKYQTELDKFFKNLDSDYNKKVTVIENQIKNMPLESDRKKSSRQLKNLQRQYARTIVTEVIATLDKHGALEFTQNVLQGGKDFQKVMGL